MTMRREHGERPFQRLAVRLDPEHLSDGQLLGRFVGDRDEVAFAVLVRRHAGLVYGVCRRMLRNGADADDAFQATFLVLLRKAVSLTDRAAVGDWLYAVAVRVAMKARSLTGRRWRKEAVAAGRRPEADHTQPTEPLDWFDRELASLPPRYRDPVVLCLIQKHPREAAAATLGIPEGTLASRLAYAKKWLAARLERQGITAPAAFVATVPASLLDATAAHALGTAASDEVKYLATGGMRAMLTTKLRVGVLATVAGLALVGGGVLFAGPGDRLAYRVQRRNAPVPQKAEPEPDWMPAFRKVYQLKEGEYVKCVQPPHIPERREFLLDRSVWKGLTEESPGVKSWLAMGALFLDWDGQKVTYKTMISTEADEDIPGVKTRKKRVKLSTVIGCCTGRYPPEVVYDEGAKLQDVFMEGDFVIRKDAPLEKLFPDLQKTIAQCELDVVHTPPVLTLKEVEQEVYVVSGKFEINPRDWREKDEVDVYAEEAVVSKEYNHKTHEYGHDLYVQWRQAVPGNFPQVLGSFINTRMVCDTELPATPKFNVYLHVRNPNRVGKDDQAADHDPEKVLANVSEQTGLKFTKVKRKVQVLYVSVPEKK